MERPGAGAVAAPPAGPGVAKVAPAAGGWSEHQNIDMCGQGDVEIIHDWRSTHSVDDLKRIVEQKGYSAVCVGSFGHAALKKFPYQLTPGHCKPSRGYTNTLYIWENGGGAVTAQPQAVKSYQPGDLSARAVKGCYVGTCLCPVLWAAFHITPVSDDEFEDCGCAGRRGTRASRRDLSLARYHVRSHPGSLERQDVPRGLAAVRRCARRGQPREQAQLGL